MSCKDSIIASRLMSKDDDDGEETFVELFELPKRLAGRWKWNRV